MVGESWQQEEEKKKEGESAWILYDKTGQNAREGNRTQDDIRGKGEPRAKKSQKDASRVWWREKNTPLLIYFAGDESSAGRGAHMARIPGSQMLLPANPFAIVQE
jgi:hypothetical protein